MALSATIDAYNQLQSIIVFEELIMISALAMRFHLIGMVCLLVGTSAHAAPAYQIWSYRQDGTLDTGFRDINASGNVVGYYQTSSTDPSSAHALLIVDGSAQNVDPPSSIADRRAFGINDAGDVAGSFDASGQHSFVRSSVGGTYETIDVPGVSNGTTVRALNNAGNVAGEFVDATGANRGFARVDGVFRMIDVPGATLTAVRAIDDDGRMAGYFADPLGRLHGFVSDDGVVFTTIDRPGAFSTLIAGFGAGGVLVGVSLDASGTPDSVPARGFFYSDGNFTAFDMSGALSTLPLAMNVHGQVAGEYVDADGRHWGFVATPISEPVALTSLLLASLMAHARFRNPLRGTRPNLERG